MSVRTGCTYDCPDACGLCVEADGERLTIRGDPDHPITRGFVCQRIHRHPARLRASDRLRAPLRRRAGGFEELSWDAALDLAATRLREALRDHGAGSIVHVQGGGSLGLSKELVGHFFNSLGAITAVGGGVCGEAGEEAQRLDFGDCAGHDYTDLVHSGAVVLWGKNPVTTGPHLVPFLKQARDRGAPIALIEIVPSASSKLADRVVRVAPSGDGLLALAVLRTLVDRNALDRDGFARCENGDGFLRLLESTTAGDLCHRAGATREDVEYLAELYACQRPVATLVGWGLQRRRSGGRNLRCIDALGLLTGNVGIQGGGVSFTSWRRRGLDRCLLAPHRGRELPASNFGAALVALRDPAAHFVYVCCANPVTQFADSDATAAALRQTGFVVVADAFLTDTAACADLVLPVSLMLEEGDDVVGSYAHHHLAAVRRAVAPPEGVRDDLWIVHQLHRRLGLPPDPILEAPAEALRRLTAPWLLDGGNRDDPSRNPTQARVPFASGFPTSSGKALLLTDLPDTVPQREGFPLILTTLSHQGWQTSQRTSREQDGLPECFVSPHAPGAERLEDGETAVVISPVGRLKSRVRFDARLSPEVCLIYRGGSLRFGHGVNVLVAPAATDVGGGTAFYDQRVRLEPAR